jgi:hypothetical protein
VGTHGSGGGSGDGACGKGARRRGWQHARFIVVGRVGGQHSAEAGGGLGRMRAVLHDGYGNGLVSSEVVKGSLRVGERAAVGPNFEYGLGFVRTVMVSR